MLAHRLGYRYVDTGALYRGIALEARNAGLNPDDDAGLNRLCRTLELEFRPVEDGTCLYSNNIDITGAIRSPEISMLASAISARPLIRNYLLDVQRQMAREKAAVFEGRDMGTVVFPEADVKFFLDASLKVRAHRRYNEIKSKTNKTAEEIQREVAYRDTQDSTRAVAPLKPAEDAITIDSTDMTTDEVVEAMLSYIK
jgi:cytidylate kinase